MWALLCGLRQRREWEAPEAEDRGLLEAMGSELCPGPGESKGGETEHRGPDGGSSACGVFTSHPASCGCGSLAADGTVGFWVPWKWPSQGSWGPLNAVLSASAGSAALHFLPETAGKPPNHFQTSNQEPTLTLKGSPCELSGRRGGPLGAPHGAPPLLGASSGGGATPGQDWPQEGAASAAPTRGLAVFSGRCGWWCYLSRDGTEAV